MCYIMYSKIFENYSKFLNIIRFRGRNMYGVSMLVIILFFCVFAIYLAFRKKRQ